MFNAESRGVQNAYPAYSETRVMAPVPEGAKGMTQDNWQHGSGQVCFDRNIDPSFYPPLTKQP